MLLPDVVVGSVTRSQAVTVIPLYTAGGPPLAYRLGIDALARGDLEVHEAGAVDRLEARNRGSERVLIVEGDHLVGAKQNRVVTSTALIGGRSNLTLPVSCVEQGRWEGASSRFEATSSVATSGLRRIVKLSVTRSLLDHGQRGADQQGIWSKIASQQQRLSVSSATRALAHTYASRAGEIGRIAGALPYVPAARGLAIAVAGELVSIDLFDKPETCRFYWPRLVEGAALESLDRRPRASAVGATEVTALVDRLRDAAWHDVVPIGDGEERRTRVEGAAASAVMLDGRLVHLGVATGVAVSSLPKPVRRDLPDALAERYKIVDRIGVGGTKEVFRATELATQRDVAIARIPSVDRDDFAAEIELAARIGGTYTPEIFEAFVDDYEDGYMVMEYCAGPNLAQLVAAHPLPIDEAVPILLAFARGLCAIHAAHVLHRDVKLENALLCATSKGVQLKILDFGISAQAHSATTAVTAISLTGTLPYMPREVLRGTSVDARTDVYAFGVCCYRMLVGELPVEPLERESEFDYMLRLGQVVRHDLSRLPALHAIVGRMLDVERDQRPFMPDVVAALEAAFGDPPLVIPAPRAVPPVGAPTRHRS